MVRVLLVAHERGHEVAQGDAGGRRTSQECKLHDEGVACSLRLPLHLGDEGVVGPDHLAGYRVGGFFSKD